MRIPFNRPYTVGTEFAYIAEAIERGHLSGNGVFNQRCRKRVAGLTGARWALLTPSCTAALEMAALLAEVGPGDEVIMPSFTFVTTATAFVLRGAMPVFVDIRPDTLNIDERLVEAAITERTKAIVAVHYAGVACEMDELAAIADRHGVLLIEDAAQGLMSSYKDRGLGGIGHLGAVSFHETKNVTCGEGGALLLRDDTMFARAEILQEKGTNRSSFFRGEVDKYTWTDLGSSFLLSEVSAAFLWAQLERAEEITALRLGIWDRYHEAFAILEEQGLVQRPVMTPHHRHNAHMYYLLMRDIVERDRLIRQLAEHGIHAVFHYVPLHGSPAGRHRGRVASAMGVTDDTSNRLVRLPLWPGLTKEMVEAVIGAVLRHARELQNAA